MGNAIALNIELGNSNGNGNGNDANAVSDKVDASRDAAKLPRALVAGGVGESAAALYLALFRSPPPGLFLWNKLLFYAYYGVLVAAVLFGVAEAWAGFWVSHDPLRRRAVGMTLLWVSLLPLLFLAGVGGFAILK